MPATQSFKSHTRWDPVFHFLIAPVLLANVISAGVRAYHMRDGYSHWMILVAIVLFLLSLKARSYAIKVQDRVIRLEERLRLKELVTASELIELDSLTLRQYIALRFASNVELPDLARRAVRENLTSKQIKEAIQSWRPDNDRV